MRTMKFGLTLCLLLCLYPTAMMAQLSGENSDTKFPTKTDDLNVPTSNNSNQNADEPKASEDETQPPAATEEFGDGDDTANKQSEFPEDGNTGGDENDMQEFMSQNTAGADEAMEFGAGAGDAPDTHEAHLGSSAVHSFEQDEYKPSEEVHAENLAYAGEHGISVEGKSHETLKQHVQIHKAGKKVAAEAVHHGIPHVVPAGGIKTPAQLKHVKGKVATHVAAKTNAHPNPKHVIAKAAKYGVKISDPTNHKEIKQVHEKMKTMRKAGTLNAHVNSKEAKALHTKAKDLELHEHVEAGVPKEQHKRVALKKAVVAKTKADAKAKRAAKGKKAPNGKH